MDCSDVINVVFPRQSVNRYGVWINSGEVTARLVFGYTDITRIFAFQVLHHDISKADACDLNEIEKLQPRLYIGFERRFKDKEIILDLPRISTQSGQGVRSYLIAVTRAATGQRHFYYRLFHFNIRQSD